MVTGRIEHKTLRRAEFAAVDNGCVRIFADIVAVNRACQTVGRVNFLARYDEIARRLTGTDVATSADGLAWVQELSQALAVPPLSEFGMTQEDIPAVVTKSKDASSMKGNPIVLSEEELSTILAEAL